jgi:hypothetical protein
LQRLGTSRRHQTPSFHQLGPSRAEALAPLQRLGASFPGKLASLHQLEPL